MDTFFYMDYKEYKFFEKKLYKRYNQVKYIAIQRDFNSYLSSYLNMSGHSFKQRQKRKLLAIILGTARYTVFYREIEKIIRQKSGLFISYNDLIDNYSETHTKIENYLGIKSDFEKTSPFKKNTSFHNKVKKDSFGRFVNIIKWIFDTFPLTAKFVLKAYSKFFAKDRMPLYWRLKKEKYFKERLIKELQTTNDTMLVEYLREQ